MCHNRINKYFKHGAQQLPPIWSHYQSIRLSTIIDNLLEQQVIDRQQVPSLNSNNFQCLRFAKCHKNKNLKKAYL